LLNLYKKMKIESEFRKLLEMLLFS